ncbi:MAG: hypothetical protein AAGI01_16795 [Myxococcota bacterium]
MKTRLHILATSVLTLCPAANVQAQDVMPPRQTLEEPPEPRRARDDVRAARRDPTDAWLKQLTWPAITPTAQFGYTVTVSNEDIQWRGPTLWLGATYYPRPMRVSPMLALGVKLESYPNYPDDPVDVFATARLGAAYIHKAPHKFLNQMLAHASAYAIVGWRPRGLGWRPPGVGLRPERMRLGVGVSSPVVGPGTAFMLLNGFPLPNILEVVVDIEPGTLESAVLLQIGIGI